MPKRKYHLIAAVCIILSIGVIVGSYQIGLERAMTGQDALLWLHVGAFLITLVLILVAIISNTKAQKR